MFGNRKHIEELEQENMDLIRKIDHLRYENMRLKAEKERAEEHLKKVLPIVGHEDFKPALSEDCYGCKYGVLDTYTKMVIGCRKDNVCSDFKPEEE